MPANDPTTSDDNSGTEEQTRRRTYYEANREACIARGKVYYHNNKEKFRQYRQANKEKINARRKAHRKANPDQTKAYRVNNREKINAKGRMYDKRKYGLTDKEYFALLDSCKGRCPCCKSPFTKMFGTCATPCIDHCHESGKTKEGIRGIICNRCNLLLGYAHDSVKILRACADYLEQKRARPS